MFTKHHLKVIAEDGRRSHVPLEKFQSLWCYYIASIFSLFLVFDWRTKMIEFIPSAIRWYILPPMTLLPFLLIMEPLAAQRHRASPYERGALAVFLFYVFWIASAIFLELIASTHNQISMYDQRDAYMSFAELVAWALLGYYFTTCREDAEWLLHRIALATACICAYAYVPIAMGKSSLSLYDKSGEQIETLSLTGIAPPNWGVQAFLLFGYCWFLTQALLPGRRDIRSIIGLSVCCVLWIQMTKSTVFGLLLGTLTIIGLLLRNTTMKWQVLVKPVISLAAVAVGLVIIISFVNGDFIERVNNYVAQRFFKVETLQFRGQSFNDIAATASTGRMEIIWPQAIDRFKRDPLFGCGFNQRFETPPVPIHNAYLDILLGVGVFGALPFLLGFGWWFATVWKALRQPQNIPLLVPCLGFTACFCAINCGDLLRYFYLPILFFGLMLGISMKVAILTKNSAELSN